MDAPKRWTLVTGCADEPLLGVYSSSSICRLTHDDNSLLLNYTECMPQVCCVPEGAGPQTPAWTVNTCTASWLGHTTLSSAQVLQLHDCSAEVQYGLNCNAHAHADAVSAVDWQDEHTDDPV